MTFHNSRVLIIFFWRSSLTLTIFFNFYFYFCSLTSTFFFFFSKPPMEEYIIRESTMQDIEEVAMLLASSFTADDFPVKSYWSLDHSLEMARKVVSILFVLKITHSKDFSSCLPDGLCFVAVGNTSGKIIGVVNIFDSTTPHLSKEEYDFCF